MKETLGFSPTALPFRKALGVPISQLRGSRRFPLVEQFTN
jgi:hypothetical protein